MKENDNMNIAIIIGVSKYDNFVNLNQCKNDAIAIRELLSKSKKYDDILYINESNKSTKSGAIFDELDRFIKKNSGKKIDELLFYFSGHGITLENEFYYCTTNTNEDRINSTSILNKNLDSIIKQLSPKLYVKIIDACESGSAYIKGINDREKILDKEKGKFNSCYFFSSSQQNQESFVRKKYSEFTYQLLEIINNKGNENENNIKYRDLSNELSDAFDGLSQQPFFVMQGSLSETFISIDDNIKEFLTKKLNEEEKVELNKNVIPKKEEETNEEKAIEFKSKITDNIFSTLKNVESILKDYSYSIDKHEKKDNIIPRKMICNWLMENQEKYFVFAKTKETRVLKKDSYHKILKGLSDYEYLTNDFDVNVDNENYECEYEYISTRNAFPKMKCQMIFLYSLTKLYIFYGYGTSVSKSWTEYNPYKSEEKVKYKIISYKSTRKEKEEIIGDICNDFIDYSENFLSNFINSIM